VKTIVASAAFATLMASPLFAERQTHEGSVHSRAYLKQIKQLRVDRRGFDGGAQNPDYPTLNPDPISMPQGLCTTAPGFCRCNGG
jgi:hypothetical protein